MFTPQRRDLVELIVFARAKTRSALRNLAFDGVYQQPAKLRGTVRDGREKLLRLGKALLHESGDGRGSPFPGRTYPTASVTGMPSAV